MKLLVVPKAFGDKPASNFSIKAMALLAMAGLPYELVETTPNKGPRGKLPVLIDGAETIPDSTHIQSHLEKRHGVNFDAGLDPKQLADAEAFRRMVEEHLYWVVLHQRYFAFPNETREAVFAGMPGLMRKPFFSMIRRQVSKALRGHGLGRHTPEQVEEFGLRDLNALAIRIGEGPFFFGDRPTSIDASVYPILHSFVAPTADVATKRFVTSNAALMAYVDCCEAAFFGPNPFRAARTGA
jgi:glutathione S-transferase